MLRFSWLIFALGLAALPVATSAQQADPGMVRIWNGSGSGVVRVAVARMAGGGYGIRVWGSCSPTPCDWGLRPLHVYGGTTSARFGAWGTATFTSSFSVTRVVIEYGMTGLGVRTFTHFTDNSGRSDYTMYVVLL
ncbi:MAG: hypothetical protein ACYC8W_08355 [Candidatus Tyrphobacter sp.]